MLWKTNLMKKWIAFLVYSLSSLPLFNKFFKKVYFKICDKIISELKDLKVKQIYIKGGILTNDFRAGLSDVDFVIISDSKQLVDEIDRIFTRYNKSFPFIKDYEFVSDEEIKFLAKFGGAKYIGINNWKSYLDYNIKFEDYCYFPLKFFINQLEEFYFLLIWLFENLNELNNSDSSKYRKLVIERTLKKIMIVLYWIENPVSFIKPSFEELPEFYHGNYSELKEIALEKNFNELFYEFLSKLSFMQNYLESLPKQLVWLENSMFKEVDEEGILYRFNNKYNFFVPKNRVVSKRDSIILTKTIFDLFHYCGLLSPEGLKFACLNTKNSINGVFFRSIDIANSIKQSLPYPHKDMKAISELISSIYKTTFEKPIPFLKKTTFITVNWGYDAKRFKAMLTARKQNLKQKGDFEFFHLDLKLEKYNTESVFKLLGTNVLTLIGNESQLGLWHKESLYNIAAHFCFGSKNFIFSDSEVYSDDPHWLEKTESLLNKEHFDFVHGFKTVYDTEDKNYHFDSWTYKYLKKEVSYSAPGLVWALSKKFLDEIDYLPDSLPDGSCDGAFIQEISTEPMGFVNSFHWYNRKIRTHKRDFKITYVDVDVMHVNHGDSRDYYNRGVLLDMIPKPFEDYYQKNEFGVYSWITDNEHEKEALQIKNIINKENPEKILKKVEDLISNSYLRVPQTMMFLSSVNPKYQLEVKGGLGLLFDTENGGLEILTSRFNSQNTKIKLIFGQFEIFDNEYIRHKFVVHNNGDVFDSNVTYNWWNLFGANDINIDYFSKRKKQIIELVPSSWANHSTYLVELFPKTYTPGNRYLVEKIEKENISLHHAWNFLDSKEFNSENLMIVKDRMYLDLDDIVVSEFGWILIEFNLEVAPDSPFRVALVAGNKLKPITATRKYNKEDRKHLKIIFYKNEYVAKAKLMLKFANTSSFENSKILVKALKRKNLS